MQGKKIGGVMGMGFATRWAHEPADPMKTLKVFLCALCDLWCEIMGGRHAVQWERLPYENHKSLSLRPLRSLV